MQQANDPYEALFPAGVIAMIPGGSWNALTFSQANPAIQVAPLPTGKTASLRHPWSGQCDLDRQPEAMRGLEWVKYLASADAERILGETGTVIPAMEGSAGRLGGVDSEHGPAGLPRRGRLLVPVAGFAGRTGMGDQRHGETLIEGWSGGIPPDEICVRADEAADAPAVGAAPADSNAAITRRGVRAGGVMMAVAQLAKDGAGLPTCPGRLPHAGAGALGLSH